MLQLYSILTVLLTLCLSRVSAVLPIVVEGSDFVNSVTKERFQIIGVAYQPGGSSGFNPGSGVDPLSNGTICLRDAALMQRLGVNTIRVYNLDPDLNHDACASIFNTVGIYMLLDVNSPLPGQSLNRGDPASSYDSDYLSRIFGVVEAFKNYPNTLGFFSGNEVINDDQSASLTPPYLRAVTRDLKNYIAKHSPRVIPVGYSAADVRPLLASTWSYLSCSVSSNLSTPDASRIDFFGLNSYSWCGVSSYTISGYDQLVALFSNTTVPVFFSEYGCNQVLPRVFDEVLSLYGPKMTPVMSGGLIYEYSQEVSDFGLVSLNDNGTCSIRIDYDNLQKQYQKLDIQALESSNVTATSLTPPRCDSSLISYGAFAQNFSIPDLPSGGQAVIDNGIKNPNNGKLISITDDNVTSIVYNSNGQELTNLAIKPLPNDQSNVPGENTSGTTANASSSAAKPTATKKGAACRGQGMPRYGVLVGILGVVGWLVGGF